jgi:hypothetical protein
MEILNFEKFCLLEDGDGGGEGFGGYGSTEGMGNPSVPTSDTPGSGDTFNAMGVYHNTSGHSLTYVKNFMKKEKKRNRNKRVESKSLKSFKEFYDKSSDLQQK